MHWATPLVPAEVCQRYLAETESRTLPATPEAVAEAVENIASVYPKSSIADPKRWVAAVGMILAEYPNSVVQRCGHPVTGIMRTVKFVPVPAEIDAWCRGEQARQRGLRYLAQRTLAEHERRAQEAAMLAEIAEERARRLTLH